MPPGDCTARAKVFLRIAQPIAGQSVLMRSAQPLRSSCTGVCISAIPLPVVDLLYKHLSAQVNLLNIFSNVETNMDALHACCDGIDLLITMQYFRLWGGPYGGDTDVIYRFLRERDVPLLVGLRCL